MNDLSLFFTAATVRLSVVVVVMAMLRSYLCCVRPVSRKRDDGAPGVNGSVRTDPAKHLVILVNGIVGSAKNWKYAADQFKIKFGENILVHCSARNAATLTFDGVDVMGHRLAQEVKEVIEQFPGLEKISFVAHSLGGLVARYAVGQLYCAVDASCSPNSETSQRLCSLNGTISGLEPVNFVTVATPHLGSWGNGQLPFLCGIRFLEKVACYSAHWFIGRTGRHLFLTDHDTAHAPLLKRMVADCPEGKFMSALQSFQRRVVYANTSYDHMVGWRTATIRRDSELPEGNLRPIDSKYPHIVHVEDVPPEV